MVARVFTRTHFRAEDADEPQFYIDAALISGILSFEVLAVKNGRRGRFTGRNYFDVMMKYFGKRRIMDEKIVNELRQMFLDGATPSQLMHHIATQLGHGPRMHFAIKDYLSAAFGIKFLRNILLGEDYSPNTRHAHFNRDIAPEIAQKANEWSSVSLDGSWLEGITIKPLTEHIERVKSVEIPELKRIWANFNDEEKQFIVRKIATKDYSWEVINLLASMAERLQQKIFEIEERLKKEEGITHEV